MQTSAISEPSTPPSETRVTRAVAEASRKTGVDFAYLMAKASTESGMNPEAKASTSSATGLYQFIDQTWLQMVDRHGDKYGLDWAAKQIDRRNDGRAVVSDPSAKREILDLRNDPRLSALMAGEFAQENRAHLEAKTKGPIGPTELYLAHFLGAGAASDFINARAAGGGQAGADLFPVAAKANRGVFYHRNGEPQTLDEIHARFAAKFDGAHPRPAEPDHVASPSYVASSPRVDGWGPVRPASVTTLFDVMLLAQMDDPLEKGTQALVR